MSDVVEAGKQMNALTSVIAELQENQQGAAKFSSGQLVKVNKQLDDLSTNQTINANLKTKGFNAVASIGTNLQSQVSNFKSNDPIKITTGVLTLISGVAMCFGPPVGTAIGAITGLVGGIMSLFGGTPKPTLTEVIGDMIKEQTKQIGKMLEEVTEHIDDELAALAKEIREGFKELAKQIRHEFENQQEFIETQFISNASSGGIAVLEADLVHIKGYIAGYDESKGWSTGLMTQISSTKDGVKEIGEIKTKIQEKLSQLAAIIEAVDEKQKDEELYWKIQNYTIRISVALINVYVTMSTLRYMVLFNLHCILLAAEADQDASGILGQMKAMKTEGKSLLEFIGKPKSNAPHEIIISGYLRSINTAPTIDAYLKLCSDGEIDLLSYVPKFNPNILYALQSTAFKNNVLVTGGIVDERAFVAKSQTELFDATVNNYSVYYKLQPNKTEPWKTSLIGYRLIYDGVSSTIIAEKSISIDYNDTLLIAMVTADDIEEKKIDIDDDEKKIDDEEIKSLRTESTTFMLLTKDDPGDLFKIKSDNPFVSSNDHEEKTEEKKPENEGSHMLLAASIVTSFDRTKNFQRNAATFKLELPKSKIENISEIVPSDQVVVYKPDPDFIPKSNEPEYKAIKLETAQKIKTQNAQILTYVIDVLNKYGVDGKYFKYKFEANNATLMGKQLAVTIEHSARNLIAIRAEMRRSAQLVFEIRNFKPGVVDDEKRKTYWNSIDTNCKVITDAVQKTFEASSKFWGFLDSFAQAFQNVVLGQEGDDEKEKESILASLDWLTQDLDEFEKWSVEFKETTDELQKKIANANNDAIDKGTIGSGQVQHKQETLIAKQNLYNQRLNEIRDKQIELQNKISPIQSEIFGYEQSIAENTILSKYAAGEIKDFELELTRTTTLLNYYGTELLKKDCTDSYEQEYTKEYAWGAYAKTYTKTIKTNRRTSILKEKKEIEDGRKEQKDSQKEFSEKKSEIDARIAKCETSKKYAEAKLTELKKKWNEQNNAAIGKLQIAFTDWNNSWTEIQADIETTGQSQDTLAEFLSITQQLLPASVRTAESVSFLQTSMSTIVKTWVRQCDLNVTVKQYCDENFIALDVAELLENNKYSKMIDLDFDGETEDYTKLIEEKIFDNVDVNVNNVTISRHARKALKEAATKPNETWIPHMRDVKEKKIRNIFATSLPILREYVMDLSKILNNAKRQLDIDTFDEKQSIINVGIPLKAIEPPSGPIIVEVDDDDIGDPLKAFFDKLGIPEYYKIFVDQGLQDLSELKTIDDAQLKDLGVTKVFHRNKIIKAAKEL